jgi:hypothetical protein
MIKITSTILKSIADTFQRIIMDEIENINSFYKYYEEVRDCG